MSKDGGLLNKTESLPPVLAPTLRIINRLVAEGLIESYSIGGSLAILYYSEPFHTDDMDIFCYVPGKPILFQLGPVWQFLENLGYKTKGLYITIEGVDVQFLSPGPNDGLEMEAMDTAVSIEVEGVPTHIFQLEYALAIKVKAGRPKNWNHIEIALNSAEPDVPKLESILQKFGLIEKWRRYSHGRV
jgi:hypothetical protein